MSIKKGTALTACLLLGLAGTGRAQSTGAPPTAMSSPSVTSGSTPSAAPEVLAYADEMPAFPGGDAALYQFLAQKTSYPAEANQRNLSGTVYIRFVVDEQGRILDAEVAKGCGNGFDAEALRVVRLMPWWQPGRMAGQPVRVVRTLPIIFRLSR